MSYVQFSFTTCNSTKVAGRSALYVRTFPSAETEDIDRMCALFARFAEHPSYLKVNDKALVSTFSGESSLFGHSSFIEAWSTIKRKLETSAEVSIAIDSAIL